MEKEWFASWFDSPYYPMLYRHRDEEEAKKALTNLHSKLSLPTGATVLDLGCGQGRHSRTLRSLGYTVVGIDLSPSSIAKANELASEGERFEVQDMRTFAVTERFDAVFNLFTSFGYFDDHDDNLRVLTQIAAHLHPSGTLVLDYLNAFPLLTQDEQEATRRVDQVVFHTHKKREGDSIVKYIEVHDGDETFHFRERVQLITLNQFQSILTAAGFTITEVFGNYELESYIPEVSPRCLIIARKS
jgi:SAM-dependent methyltransferase